MKAHMFAYRDWAYRIAEDLHKASKPLHTVFVPTDHWVHAVDYLTYSSVEEDDFGVKLKVKKVDPKKMVPEDLGIEPNDLLLFYGWSWMVPPSFTDNYTCICLHPSPLPKYRGGSPIQNQIFAGETKSAVTLFKMGQGLDDGPIFYQEEFALNGYLQDIFGRIIGAGFRGTSRLLDAFEKGPVAFEPQAESQATLCKRRKPSESEILPTDTAQQIYDKVRALQYPYPNAFFRSADGKKILVERVSF